MNFQIDVSSAAPQSAAEPPHPPTPHNPEVIDLLRQMLEVQREQLTYQRAAAAAHDMTARWRAFLVALAGRVSRTCPKLPAGHADAGALLRPVISDLTERSPRTTRWTANSRVQEFLDRYGMRLAQLGTILNLVAPLAEAGPQGESA